MRRPVRTHVALEGYDRAFALLLGAGWDGAHASAIMAAIDYLVLGSALERTTRRSPARSARRTAPRWTTAGSSSGSRR
jgi:hypothetical protein